MAIRQNLARLPDELLTECTRSVSALDAVCSFEALEAGDYLDLDWVPHLLHRVVRAAGVPDELAAALHLATAGAAEVNPAYRDIPNGIAEHPVSGLGPDEVRRVEASLRAFAKLAPLTSAAVDRGLQGLPDSALPTDPVGNMETHFRALRDCYSGAAIRGLAVVVWQD